MYEYNNENRPQDPWSDPIETTGRPVHEEPEPPRPRKKKGGKLVALCLVCAIVGGIAGGAGVAAATGSFSKDQSTIYEGTRPTTVVDVSNVTGKEPLTAPEIYATYVGSTVGITTEIVTTNGWGQPVSQAAAGSGFVITEDGYILTNYHIIEDADSIQVSFVDGTTYDATLVGGESENDIAVLKIDATGLTPVIIGDSDNVKVGEQVVAIGNPLGELTFSMTSGIVSAKDRSITMENGEVMNMIQTDTAINSGNSGGPLFNSHGEVIGIVSAKYSSSASSSSASVEGLGFAIPMDDVADMVSELVTNGYVTGKPLMGISVGDVAEDVQAYGVPAGAAVKVVTPGLCGEKAGLQEGDIITKINDTEVASGNDLITAKDNYKPGDTVNLTVYRDGKTITVKLTLEESTPEKTAQQDQAQKEYEEQQQQQLQQEQQQGSGGWPFGGFGY